MRSAGLWIAAVLLLTGAGGAAWAQEGGEGEGKLVTPEAGSSASAQEALRLYKIGELQFDGKEFAQAAETFARAFKLDPNPVLAFNVARAWENDGRLELAREWYSRVLELSPGDDVKVKSESALVRLARLEQRLKDQLKDQLAGEAPKVAQVSFTSAVAGAQVSLNGEALGAAPVERELDPGEYVVEFRAEGYYPRRQQIVVKAGEKQVVSATLEEEPFPVSWLGWTGLGLVLVGGTGFVVGGIFESDARAAFEEAQGLEARRDAELFGELRTEGEGARDTAQAAYLGGIGLVGVGVVLFALDLALNLTYEPPSGEGVSLDVGIGPGGGVVQARW